MSLKPHVRLTVFGKPQPKGSARAFVPKGWERPIVTSANPNLKGWEDAITTELQRVMDGTPAAVLEEIFRAPVAVTLVFHVSRPKTLKRGVTEPTKKPDLDKLTRAAIDALTGVLIQDDSHVVAIGARKRYATGSPRLDILVESWAPVHSLAVATALSSQRPHGTEQRTHG